MLDFFAELGISTSYLQLIMNKRRWRRLCRKKKQPSQKTETPKSSKKTQKTSSEANSPESRKETADTSSGTSKKTSSESNTPESKKETADTSSRTSKKGKKSKKKDRIGFVATKGKTNVPHRVKPVSAYRAKLNKLNSARRGSTKSVKDQTKTTGDVASCFENGESSTHVNKGIDPNITTDVASTSKGAKEFKDSHYIILDEDDSERTDEKVVPKASTHLTSSSEREDSVSVEEGVESMTDVPSTSKTDYRDSHYIAMDEDDSVSIKESAKMRTHKASGSKDGEDRESVERTNLKTNLPSTSNAADQYKASHYIILDEPDKKFMQSSDESDDSDDDDYIENTPFQSSIHLDGAHHIINNLDHVEEIMVSGSDSSEYEYDSEEEEEAMDMSDEAEYPEETSKLSEKRDNDESNDKGIISQPDDSGSNTKDLTGLSVEDIVAQMQAS